MVYVQDIENIEIHHVLDFFIVMFDKRVTYRIIKNGKCEFTTVLDVSPHPYEHKSLLVLKYTIGIFKIRFPKIKIS